MASIDYGCLIKKNGKILNEDEQCKTYKIISNITDGKADMLLDFQGCCGDKELVFWFYKDFMRVYNSDMNEILSVGYNEWNYQSYPDVGSVGFMDNRQHIFYQRYSLEKEVKGIKLKFKRFDDGNRYKLRFWYKNDLYEVIYGYGVDTNLDYFYGLSKNKKTYMKKWLKGAI